MLTSKYLADADALAGFGSVEDIPGDRLVELAHEIIEEMSERGHITTVADKYAASEHEDPPENMCGILFGNWNHCAEFKNPGKHYCDLRILEAAHYELEWLDEWDVCSECCGAVRVSPTSYGWKPKYWMMPDVGCVCAACIMGPEDATERSGLMDAYIEYYKGRSHGCMVFGGPEVLCSYGYKQLDEFERGLHRGQSADPLLIGEALRARGISDFIFYLDSTGQFDVQFSVWVPKDTVAVELERDETHNPPGEGPAELMERALRSAPPPPPGAGAAVIRPHPDGTATSRRVPGEDFIAGRALDD